MVQCGHMWQALYALKAKAFLVPPNVISTAEQSMPANKPVKDIVASRSSMAIGKGSNKKKRGGEGSAEVGTPPAKRTMRFEDFSKKAG